MLYKSNCLVVDVSNSDKHCIEHICFDLRLPLLKLSFRFLCAYCPPDLSRNTDYVSLLMNCISAYKNNSDIFYVLGDFNMPKINWGSLYSCNKASSMFLDFCIESGLLQQVQEPTSKHGSTLDLMLCDELSLRKVTSVEVLPPLTSTCDHSMLEINLDTTSDKNASVNIPEFYVYRKGDYHMINKRLSEINWSLVFSNLNNDVQKIYNYFVKLMHTLMQEYIPKANFKKTVKRPSYINKMAKQKKKLYKRLKSNGNLKREYNEFSRKYDKAVAMWYDSIERKVCQGGNQNSFFKYANKKMKSFPSIPPLKSPSGGFVTDDKEKADLLNETFYSVFITDDGKRLNLSKRVNPEDELTNVFVDAAAIEDALSSLPYKTSKTPDGLPSFVIKKTAAALLPFLTRFYNLSLQTGQLPCQWKTAKITPVFKGGDRSCPQNHRPISQTSVLCRLLEKIIARNIHQHLITHDLISNVQHAFLPGRSTISQLLKTIGQWKNTFCANGNVDVIYTDLAKAFDKVSHPKLLEVVQSYGITGNLYNWIRSFLSHRKQTVSIGVSLSDSLSVQSGVPQGSVIGPLLFILFIDDLSRIDLLGSKLSMYADDVKVYSSNPNFLQSDLNAVVNFFEKRQLQLAPAKCKYLAVGKATRNHNYLINDQEVDQCSSVKDLGVTIMEDLKWTHHINTIKSQAFRKCFHILKSFHSKNIWTLLKAYLVFVRPKLEFSSVIWTPQLLYLIRSLESVQRLYTRRICDRCKIPYDSYQDRLYKLNIKSLRYRRVEADLVMVYKILHSLVDLSMHDFFEYYLSPYNTRRHTYCLKVIRCLSKRQQGGFAERVVKIWNSLPASVVEADSLSNFRKKLKLFNLCTITDLAVT